MAWLPDGEKISKISLFVLTQLTNVTDTQTDRRTDTQTPHDGIGRAYASHRAAKMKVHMISNVRQKLFFQQGDQCVEFFAIYVLLFSVL